MMAHYSKDIKVGLTDSWPRILYMTVLNIQNLSLDLQDNICNVYCEQVKHATRGVMAYSLGHQTHDQNVLGSSSSHSTFMKQLLAGHLQALYKFSS